MMNPQYSTVRNYSLLCVLKDFSEDYSGDTDGGAQDLSLTFSIVGELDNTSPKNSTLTVKKPDFDSTESLTNIDNNLNFGQALLSDLIVGL